MDSVSHHQSGKICSKVVCHIEPTFAPYYCLPELRLDCVYMLPADPVSHGVARSSRVGIHFGRSNVEEHAQQKKPKIELLTDF